MNLNDLKNLSILVTRPGQAGEELSQYLRNAGANVLFFPTIAFIKMPLTHSLKEQLQTLNEQDIIIFISQQSVNELVSHQDYYSLNQATRLFAIGQATALLAEKLLKREVNFPTHADSENLLDLAFFKNIQEKKITIVKGLGGRELLEDQLKERGAHVSLLCLYQRILPKNNTDELITALKQKKIHVILCSSFDSVANLCKLTDDLAALKEILLIVMSHRVKELAHQLGFRKVNVINVANYQELIHFLYTNKDQLCQMNKIK